MKFPKLGKLQMTQQHLRLHPEKIERFTNVRIWSDQWRAWWRPDASGYTDDLFQAGIYSAKDALRKVNHCGPEKRILIVEVG